MALNVVFILSFSVAIENQNFYTNYTSQHIRYVQIKKKICHGQQLLLF